MYYNLNIIYVYNFLDIYVGLDKFSGRVFGY